MKKGDLASPIVMWMAVLSVAFIVIPWFAENIRPMSGEARIVETDINEITKFVSTACNSQYYQTTYNPRTNEGDIYFNSSNVCIEAFERVNCADLSCPVNQQRNISLADIKALKIQKNNSLEIGVIEFEQ